MPNANRAAQGQDPQGNGNEQVAGHSDDEKSFYDQESLPVFRRIVRRQTTECLELDPSAQAETQSPTIHKPEIDSESGASVAPSWQKAQRKKADGNRGKLSEAHGDRARADRCPAADRQPLGASRKFYILTAPNDLVVKKLEWDVLRGGKSFQIVVLGGNPFFTVWLFNNFNPDRSVGCLELF